eukprot:5831336-Prorocentrum_lima.AAC.1
MMHTIFQPEEDRQAGRAACEAVVLHTFHALDMQPPRRRNPTGVLMDHMARLIKWVVPMVRSTGAASSSSLRST